MKETDIRKYAALMQELGLTGLEITEENQKVRLERSLSAKEAVCTLPAAAEGEAAPKSEEYISIKSPIVGIFYAAFAENAKPYVGIGDAVQKGQTLCIVEAMKLMNEIVAEEDGVILEVCVKNGQVVEYGTELFRMQREKR